jgi:hypothetical protein
MERLRWLPRDFGAKHVLVNAAASRPGGRGRQTIWTSKVIVGKPQNQTVFFSDEMDHGGVQPLLGRAGLDHRQRDAAGDLQGSVVASIARGMR